MFGWKLRDYMYVGLTSPLGEIESHYRHSKTTMQRLFLPMLYSTLDKASKSGWRLRTLSMIRKRRNAYCDEVWPLYLYHLWGLTVT